MVSLNTLKFLSGQKKADVQALLSKDRNVAAIYIMGYAVELALKRRICLTLGFNTGFPESKTELQACILSIATATPSLGTSGTAIPFSNIKEIKTHDLDKLLQFSGRERHIKQHFLTDWTSVASWNPETRYVRKKASSIKAKTFVKSALKIIQEIS